jgi:hypothetical protein
MSFPLSRPGLAVAILFAVSGGPAMAADDSPVAAIGPQVGDTVPDFTLPDQEGRSRTLESLMGPQGLVLVFYRSADW